MRKLIWPIILLLFIESWAFSQSNTVSAGNYTLSDQFSLSYSVGQTQFNYSENSSISVSLGVQQWKSEIIASIPPSFVSLPKVKVYPNPTTHSFHVEIEEVHFFGIEYQLFNLRGELQLSGNFKESHHQIFLKEEVPQGLYLLRIFKEGITIRTIKILKQ